MLLVIYPTSAKQIDGNNYLSLLILAQEYMMKNLTVKCEDYLMKVKVRDELFHILYISTL